MNGNNAGKNGLIVDCAGEIPAEAEGILVQECGITAFEARQAFNSPVPAVIPLVDGAGHAAAAALGRLGIRCSVSPLSVILEAEEYPEARSLNRQSELWSFSDSFGTVYDPDPEDVYLLVAGIIRQTSSRERYEQDVQVSPISGEISGATTIRTVTDRKTDAERMLVIFSSEWPEALSIRESQFRPACLGSEMKPTRALNFARLWELITGHYTEALVDERLLKTQLTEQTVFSQGFGGLTTSRSSSESNFWRAARLMSILAMAERDG